MAHTIFHNLFLALKVIINGIIFLTIWLMIGIIGLFFFTQFASPVNQIIGLPLILISLTMALLSIYEIFISILSAKWQRTHCPYCSSPTDVKKILSPDNGFKN